MEVVFEDTKLAHVKTGEAVASPLPFAIVRSLRRKLTLIEAAPNRRALRNWKSLGYKECAGKHSIDLGKNWYLLFKLEEEREPPRITVTGVETGVND